MSIWGWRGVERRGKSGTNWTVRYISKRYCEPDDHRSKEIYTYQLTSERGTIFPYKSDKHPWFEILDQLKETKIFEFYVLEAIK